MGKPVSARNRSAPDGSPAASRAPASVVLVSCQTIAWWTGRPVRRSQTTVVSRWSLIPTAASARASAPMSRSATRTQVRTRSMISSASCSTQPGRVVIWACSSWWLATGCPVRSNRRERLLVVPWSMAATSDRGFTLGVLVGAPLDRRDGRTDVADLPEQGHDTEHEEQTDADDPVRQKRPEDASVQVVDLDLAKEDQDPVHGGRCPAERGERHHEEDRDTEGERRDSEDRSEDQADDHDEDARVETEPLEEPDAEGIAHGSAEDDDRGVVPEERDRREDEAEDEPDAP